MNILIITPDYPDSKKSAYPFVKQLVDEWAKEGHECTVLATFSVTQNRRRTPFKTKQVFHNGGSVTIIRPNIITLSNWEIFGFKLSDNLHKKGIERGLKELESKPDVIYCHFWHSAKDIIGYAEQNNIPCFVASGESEISRFLKGIDTAYTKKISGVVCVSSKNMDESIEMGLTTREKCKVFPNAVNADLFHKMNKKECREKLGFPQDAYIIIYVGNYTDRKGPKRVVAALKDINPQNVYSIFIGFGDYKPQAENMLFEGRLLHEQIPVYLNAADVFVLPTLKEGCCNAVVEAMACGLPVISSNLSFNWDVLNDTNSIMIDPQNIEQIRDAIVRLRDNFALREKLASGALKMAESLTIDQRAKAIIKFFLNRN